MATAVVGNALPTSHHHRPRAEDGARSILGFGHAADPSELKAVTTLVTRYYHYAAIDDGAGACSLLTASIAKSVPQDYGGKAGPRYMRGDTCREAMAKLFAHFHHKLLAEDIGLQVTDVRLNSHGGYALMRFKTTPELHEANVVREGSRWGIASLLDSGVAASSAGD